MRVIDHLRNSLSREEFVKALKYFNENFLKEYDTASKALINAFAFTKTDKDEGWDYWSVIYDRLLREDHPELIAKEVKTYDVHIPSYFTLNQKQIASLFEHKKAKKKLLEWFAERETEKKEEKEEKKFVTDFEVGKWYWSDEFKYLFNYKGENKAFGFNWNIWHDGYGIRKNFNFTLATPERIAEALVNEAKKRGFKDVDKLKIINVEDITFDKGMFTSYGNKFEYEKEKDILYLDGVKIYKKGKWATIL